MFSNLIGKTFNKVTVFEGDKIIDHKTVNLEDNTDIADRFVLENEYVD